MKRLIPILISVLICSCNQRTTNTATTNNASDKIPAEKINSDSIICSAIKAYLLGDKNAVIMAESAKEDLFESSWPEVFCSVDKMLDAPWDDLTVRKVGEGMYKYECTCPVHGDKYEDNCTIEADINASGEIVITHVKWHIDD